MNLQEEVISIDQLCVGVYVRLDGWIHHPFLFNAFKIRDEKQLTILRSLGIKQLHYIPAKSDTSPRPLPLVVKPVSPQSSEPATSPALAAMWQEKKARREKVTQRRAAITQCEHRFQQGVSALKSMIGSMFIRPKESVEFAQDLVSSLVTSLLAEKDAFIHLVSIKEGDESTQYHALNVAVLALLLARESGVPEAQMRALGLGALLHDIGKSEVPSKILLKRTPWTPAEQSFYEQHVIYGIRIAEQLPGLPQATLDVIAMHHEMLDGSGFPSKLRGEQIPLVARIVAIANTYDNHCNRLVPEESMTPAEALAHMFKYQRQQLDTSLLQHFIRCLGVYPPGSIVQLNTEAIGIVTGSSRNNLLQPTILLYDPNVPKDEAVFFALDDEPDLKINRTLRPGILPKEIYDYLNPRSRVSYVTDLQGVSID